MDGSSGSVAPGGFFAKPALLCSRSGQLTPPTSDSQTQTTFFTVRTRSSVGTLTWNGTSGSGRRSLQWFFRVSVARRFLRKTSSRIELIRSTLALRTVRRTRVDSHYVRPRLASPVHQLARATSALANTSSSPFPWGWDYRVGSQLISLKKTVPSSTCSRSWYRCGMSRLWHEGSCTHRSTQSPMAFVPWRDGDVVRCYAGADGSDGLSSIKS